MPDPLKWLAALVLSVAIVTLLFLTPANISWPLTLAGLLFVVWMVRTRPSLRRHLLAPKKGWMRRILWLGIGLIVSSVLWFVLSVWAFPNLPPEQGLDIFLIPSVVGLIAGWACLSLVMVEWTMRMLGLIERGKDN
jgi:hypothetical protein